MTRHRYRRLPSRILTEPARLLTLGGGTLTEPQTTELADGLLELGSALIVATVAADGEPRAARASAWSVVGRGRVRIAVAADDPAIVENLHGDAGGGSWIAVTGADVVTLRSLQLKGRVVGVTPPDDADLELIDRHRDVFVGKIQATDGHPSDVVQRFLPITHVMVEMTVEEAFDQTPGPEAGAAMRVGRT